MERYAKNVTVILEKSTRQILTLCYIFLDMHSFSRTEENLWLWFNHVKSFLGTGWKQYRRSLCQFLHYLKTGIITTAYTGDPLGSKLLKIALYYKGFSVYFPLI